MLFYGSRHLLTPVNQKQIILAPGAGFFFFHFGTRCVSATASVRTGYRIFLLFIFFRCVNLDIGFLVAKVLITDFKHAEIGAIR